MPDVASVTHLFLEVATTFGGTLPHHPVGPAMTDALAFSFESSMESLR